MTTGAVQAEGEFPSAERSRFPHPLTLLVGCVLLAAALSYVLPAGTYDRQLDEATGRTVVVPGTYQSVDPAPVNFFDAIVAIPRGMADASDIVFLVFLIGGAFAVVDATGALRGGFSSLARALGDRKLAVVPCVSLFFAAGGVLFNMQEEIIALIPPLLVLTNRLGFRPLVAVAASAGPAFVGSAFSPVNPFQVQIAQKLAELPYLSGWEFRTVFLILALVIWIGATTRYAARTRTEGNGDDGQEEGPLTSRDSTILALVLATFVVLVYGLLKLGWDFNQMSALFFIMGVTAGFIAGLSVTGTAKAYVQGFKDMAFAALLIGFARAIYLVLEDGRVVDTLVHALVTPLESLPVLASALGMLGAHILIHVPVPSVTGHAILTLPIMVPISDLLGLSRQVTVMAYHYGGGLTDLVTPTNGALLAILAAGGVRFEDWFKFTFPLFLALLGLGGAALAIGIALGV